MYEKIYVKYIFTHAVPYLYLYIIKYITESKITYIMIYR